MSAAIVPCEICYNLDARDSRLSHTYLRQDLRLIAATAKDGCPFCKILVDVVDKGKKHNIWILGDSMYIHFDKLGGSTLAVTGSDTWGFRSEFQLYRVERTQGSGSTIGSARDILDGDGLSAESLELAKGWLSDCLSNHSECRNVSQPTLPTRVLAIGKSIERPCLYISKGENVPYAALSYCWGGQVSLQTTVATLAARQKEISFTDLPPLFQDIILVLRSLEIDYVWIDSLCIVQDSPEDWAREASKMQEVYGGATLTIAADVANNPNGRLTSNARDHVRSVRVGPRVNGDEFYLRNFGCRNDALSTTHVPSVHEGTRQVLDTRGWALQERVLSARILHFGAYEMSWECDEGKWCECTVGKMKYRNRKDDSKDPLCPRYHKGARMLSGLHHANLDAFDIWKRLVEDYCARNLSFSSDRVPAFSGLTTRFECGLPDATYMAGLWKEDPTSLAWFTRFNTKKPKARNESCPTWSWTSIEGPIGFYFDYKEKHINILSWDKDNDLIRVRGPLLRFASNGIAEEKGNTQILPRQLWEKSSDIDVPWAEGQEYCLLAICTKKWSTACLILREIENREGMFVRVGQFTVWGVLKDDCWSCFENTTMEII